MPKINFYFIIPFLYCFSVLAYFYIFKTSIFFSIDPESIYYANSLAILTGNPVLYVEHPGSLFAILLSVLFVPYRVLFLLDNNSFITWWLENIENVYLVFRLFNAFIYLTGFYFLGKAVFLLSKNIISVLLFYLLVFSSSFQGYWLTVFSPESLMVLILGLWFFVAAKIITSKQAQKLYLILSILSGLGLSAKYSFIAVPLITYLFIFLVYRKRWLLSGIMIVLGFIGGVLPIVHRYDQVKTWFINLIIKSGLHGSGNASVIPLEKIFLSLKLLMSHDIWYFISLILVILMLLHFFINKKTTEIKFSFLTSIFFGSILSFLISSKYPNPYYQIINYYSIYFAVSVLLSEYELFKKAGKSLSAITILVLMIIFTSILRTSELHKIFLSAQIDQDFINNYNDKNKMTIWTYWLPSREYALIMGNIYSKFYAPQLHIMYPKIVNMDDSPKKIYTLDDKTYSLEEFCWSQAFVPGFMLEEILTQYDKPVELEVISSENKNLHLIKKLKCE